MKVVLDANVIIAAFATRGLCQSVFELCLQNHKIMMNNGILNEVKQNLTKKIKLPEARVQNILAYLKEYTEIIHAQEIKVKDCRDPKDIMVLSLTVQAKVDYLVTGDQDLLSMETISSIPIVSPRNFWDSLRKKK
jgi:uncharacterized protein